MSEFRFQGFWINPVGYAMAGGLVYICTQPNSIDPNNPTIPPSPLASLFTDSTGGTPLANPVVVDGNGNFFFYAAPALYTLVFSDPFGRLLEPIVIPDLAVTTQGGGTVNSVALTVPADESVSGSPVTGSGTLGITRNTQGANLFLAGPTSGSAATPTYRAIVTADLPGGAGSVTSVNVSISGSGLLTLTATGGPITTAGVIAVGVNVNNQAANTVWAGPTSGGSGAVTARKLVAADICGTVSVSFSTTPTFDASSFPLPTFLMTLTGNVASSTVSNPIAGQTITLILTQDGTGSRTFAFPANFKGASAIGPDANSVSVQSFTYDGTNWRATSPGLTTGS